MAKKKKEKQYKLLYTVSNKVNVAMHAHAYGRKWPASQSSQIGSTRLLARDSVRKKETAETWVESFEFSGLLSAVLVWVGWLARWYIQRSAAQMVFVTPWLNISPFFSLEVCRAKILKSAKYADRPILRLWNSEIFHRGREGTRKVDQSCQFVT